MINELLQHTLAASRQLVTLDDATINRILIDTASALLTRQAEVLAANVEDLSRMDPANPKYDRLKLTEERLAGIAGDMKNVASLPSPLGKLLSEITRPNGMVIRKMTVPFGVIGVIYEARPNVTFDVFSLCFKSGNACVLKGGSDADSSNRALVAIIHDVLTRQGVDPAVCTLLPPDREATTELLNAVGLVDLIIPRGSSSLINYVRDHARVPVIETGAGICHTYFDKDGDKEKGREIVNNAKTRRVSVCNALDCLIVHRDRLGDLPYLCGKLSGSNVIIYADEPAFAALSGHYPTALLQPATADSFGTEFRYRQPETGQLQGGLVPVDFATIAAGYGCKTWRVTTLDELRHALDAARRETVSTLIDIKVLPKTMVHKYGSWWNVGVAQTALSERIRKVAQMINEKRAQARDY